MMKHAKDGIKAMDREGLASRKLPPDSEERYRSLFENSQTVMLIDDPASGAIVDANPKAASYYGWPRETLMTMSIRDINILSAEDVLAEMAQAQAEQRAYYRFRHRKANGDLRDVDVFTGPIMAGAQELRYSIVHDVTEKRQLEASLANLTARTLFLLELPRLADTLDEAPLMQRGLEMAEELTGSHISFIHFVNDDEESIDLVTWSRRTLETYCQAAFDQHYPVAQAGIWAEALRQRQPVVFNDYAAAPGKHVLPEGHAMLQRLISLPVIEQNKVVMLAGVGNKDKDYEAEDVQTLQLIANEIWRLAQRERNQRKIARFSRMVEHSQSEIYSFDAETLQFVDVNRGACENTGYSLDELRSMTPVDLKPDLVRDAFERLIAPLRQGAERRVVFTTVHRRKDGSTYPVEIHLELFVDTRSLFVAIARDISERVAAERELKQALRVVEASPVVSMRWRAVADWPVDYVSSNVVRWGYSVEQMRAGTPRYAEIIHPDDLERVAHEVAANTANRVDTYAQEYRLRAADGRYFWVEDHTRILRGEDGNPEFYEGVVSDIDAKKQAELVLAANLAHEQELNRKLEEAQNQLLQSEKMASIGQLAAGVAHELNNPIGFVSSNLGSLETYLTDLFAVSDAYAEAEMAAPDCAELERVRAIKREKDYDFLRSDIVQLLAESKDGLARVAKIVKDLKDFSRAGETAMQWADLHQGLDSTLNIIWNELKYRCALHKEYGDLPEVWCVPAQLNQVFMNLLVNAAHAIPEAGNIVIRTGCQGEQAFVAISDSGVGIPMDNLHRIFEPFFTTKPVGQGTGLGLSLSYSIVKKHRGRIEVESEPGTGSTFTVWLPINPPAVADTQALPATKGP